MTIGRDITVILCVVDTETTGLGIFDRKQKRDDHALSIGLVVADVDLETRHIECLDSAYSLISIPDPEMANDAYHIHGISPEMVAAAPDAAEVCRQFLQVHDSYGFEFAGAWNHRFDRYFIDKLFSRSRMRLPGLRWIEMQPEMYAKLDRYATSIACDDIKALPAHNALNDCMRALGVYATIGGFEIDISRIASKVAP